MSFSGGSGSASIGNLSLGLDISQALSGVTQLETRLNALNRFTQTPIKIAVDTSGLTALAQAEAVLAKAQQERITISGTSVTANRALTDAEKVLTLQMQQTTLEYKAATAAAKMSSDAAVAGAKAAVTEQGKAERQVVQLDAAEKARQQTFANQAYLANLKTSNALLVENAKAANDAAKATDGFSVSGEALGTALGNIASKLVELSFDALKKGVDIVEGFIGSAMKMDAQLQQSAQAFTTLTGNADTAAKLLQQTEDIATHSTFGLNQIQDATQKMLAFGVSAQNIPVLLVAAQNAAAASGGSAEEMAGKYERINYVLTELAAGVPVTERQIRQLAMAGVDISAVAAQLGTTNEALFNVGKTHQFTSAQIVAAVTEVYTHGNLGDVMAKQAQTFSGAMAIIKTNLALAAGSAFKPLFDAVSELVVKFGLFVQTATFNEWVARVQQGVTIVISLLKELAGLLSPLAEGLGKLFGFDGSNLAAQMEAVKNSKPNVDAYNTALAGTKDVTDAASVAATAHADALTNAQTAATTLNDALLLPNAVASAAAATTSIQALSTAATDQAGHALTDLNALLQLPDGSVGPKNAAAAMGELKDASLAVSDVIKNLDTQLAGVKAQLDAVTGQQKAIHDQYDPGIKAAQDQIKENDRPDYARQAQEAQLTAQGVQLKLEKPDDHKYKDDIATWTEQKGQIRDAATQRNSGIGGYDDQIKAKQKDLDTLGTFDANGAMSGAITASEQVMAGHKQEWADSIKAAQDAGQQLADGYTDRIKALQTAGQDAATAYAEQVRVAQEAGRVSSQSFADQIKAAQDAGQDAAQKFGDQIDALKEKSRAAGQIFDDTIAGLKDKSSHLGEGATDTIDAQIQSLNDHIHSLNTDELDDKINRLKDTLNAPPPNTQGLKNQLTVLAAQIQTTTGVAGRAALQQSFGALSVQKSGIETGYVRNKAVGEFSLKTLENQKRDAVEVNRDTKRDDEAKVRDLQSQRKVVLDGITDQKKALADQITAQQQLKKSAAEKNADEVRGLEAAKKASAEKNGEEIKGLEAAKTAAERKTADQVRGIQETARLASEANKKNIADLTTEKERAAELYKVTVEGLKTSQAEEERNDKARTDTLKLLRSNAEADFKARQEAIKDEIQGIKDQKDAADQKDRVDQANLDTSIKLAEKLDKALMAPWLAKEAENTKQLESLRLLDEQKKAAQEIADIPLKQIIDEQTDARDKALAPLELQKTNLEAQQKLLQEERTHWQGIKTDIDNAKTALTDFSKAGSATAGDSGPLPQAPPPGATSNPVLGPPAPHEDPQWLVDLKKKIDDVKGAMEGVQKFWTDHLGPALHDLWKAITDDLLPALGKLAEALPLQDLPKVGAVALLLFIDGLTLAVKNLAVALDIARVAIGIVNDVLGLAYDAWKLWYDLMNQNWPAVKDDLKFLGVDAVKFVNDFKTAAQQLGDDIGKMTFNGPFGALITLLENQWPGITEKIAAPLNEALKPMDSFLQNLAAIIQKIGEFFDIKDLKSFSIPHLNIDLAAGALSASGKSGDTSPSGGWGATGDANVATHARATGDLNFIGGPALIGEAGRELYHNGDGWKVADKPTLLPLNRGATVLPAHITEAVLQSGVPGFAGGLIGDAIAGVQTLAGDALSLARGGADAVLAKIAPSLPTLTLPGALGPVAGKIGDAAASGLKSLVGSLIGKAAPPLQAVGNALFGAPNVGGAQGDILAAIRAVTSDPHIMGAMLMGAAMETGLKNVAQIGGGPGAGYWQIEAGPGGQYQGRVDPYNPSAAAQFMLPDYITGTGMVNASLFDANPELAYATAAYHAERPAVFYAQGQQDAAWALVGDTIKRGMKEATPTAAPTGAYGSVVAQAMKHLAETQQANGVTWNGWCEKFQNDMDDAAGFGSYRAGSAYLGGIHAEGTGALHRDTGAPAGASVWFDQSWGPAGHAAIATGQGATTISTPIADGHNDIHYADIIGRPGYMGWAPPGMAMGGLTVGGDPHVVTVGDGPPGEREWHVPEPQLREVVREESGDGGVHFHAPITIHLAKGEGYQQGRDAMNGLLDAARQSGKAG